MRKWATRDLRAGDLTALRDVAKGGGNSKDPRFDRLRSRGFVKESKTGTLSVTVLGRLALLIKSATMNQ